MIVLLTIGTEWLYGQKQDLPQTAGQYPHKELSPASGLLKVNTLWVQVCWEINLSWKNNPFKGQQQASIIFHTSAMKRPESLKKVCASVYLLLFSFFSPSRDPGQEAIS